MDGQRARVSRVFSFALTAVLALGLLGAAPASAQPMNEGKPSTEPKLPSTEIKSGKGTFQFYQPSGTAPKGGRPTIVLVPGLGCLPDDYKLVTKYLEARGFNVAIFETEGNEELEGKVWDERLAKVTDQLLANNKDSKNPLYGTIDEGRLGIMGHSLGGSVATFAAARDPRFKALVVFAPGGKDQSFLEAARKVTAPTLAIDASLDRVTPPDTQGGVVVDNSASEYKAHLVVKDGAHPNSPADFDTDFIRDSGRVVPTMKYVGFFPVMGFTYDFPIVPGIKPIASDLQRKIGFEYLGQWMDKFVAGKTDPSADFAARAHDELKSGLLSKATVSSEAAAILEPVIAKKSKTRSQPAATANDSDNAALMQKIRDRGAQGPRNGIVDGLVKAGAEGERGRGALDGR